MGLGILVYIILALVIASYANSKGRSFGFWFVISVVLDPIIGFILLQIVSFLSNAFAGQAEPVFVQASPRTIYADEPEQVSPDQLYRQSEELYQQAAKFRGLAEQLQHKQDHKTVKKITIRP